MTQQKDNPNPSATKRVAIAIELHATLPWHYQCYEGALQYGKEHGWACMLDPYLFGLTDDRKAVAYDGVVGRIDPELNEIIEQVGLPAVTLTKYKQMEQVPSLGLDSKAGARAAAEHLIASGYRRFGYIGIPGEFSAPNKRHIAGMNLAIEQHGFEPVIATEVFGNFEEGRQYIAEAREALTQWIATLVKPVGIVVRQSLMSRYLAQVCTELGLRVPEDVGIVMHSGDELTATSASPTITAIEYDFYKQGYEAAAMLDKLMQGEAIDPIHKTISGSQLIVRESTDIFICDDPLVRKAMHYIAEHVRETIAVEDIADALQTSRRTLERHFDDVLGKTIYSEIKRIRVGYIQRLLAETGRSISDIAHDCGFGNTSHFARYFKAEAGMTPSAYRQANSKS